MVEPNEIITSDAKEICEKIDFSEIKNKSILITGASGLIGAYFQACFKQLSETNKCEFKVSAIIHNEPPSFLKKLLDYDGLSIIQGDITDLKFCKGLPKADYIIHLAGYGQPGRFLKDPIKTMQINTSVTFLLFEKLNPNGKFLFASTSEVYSGLSKTPNNEFEIGNTNTTHPRACYIEAKRCGEAICNTYRGKGVNAKSARLALAYGPGTREGDTRVMNVFIRKALNGEPINLLDQGKVKRTYCYVADTVEILWDILLYGKDPVYNVGGISRITIGDLALKIGNYLNVPVVFPDKSNELVGAPDDVYLDMTKVKNEFNKTDFIPIDDGLSRTIEWQKLRFD